MIQQLSARGRRLAALGTLVGLAFSVGGLAITSASGPATPSSYVPITPCRLMDTRGGVNTIGPRNTPLVGAVPYTATVRGANGNCNIPVGATAVGLNITSLNHTSGGFLTVWPADDTKPLSSSLNWVAGQPPTPNAVTVGLSVASGQVSFQASAGTVNLIVDIVGYYLPASSSPPPARAASSGSIGNLTVTPNAWVFVGPTGLLNARVGRSLFGAGSASMGLTTGTALIDFTLCYQIGTAPLVVFLGNYYLSFKLTGTQQSLSAAAQSSPIPAQPGGAASVTVKVGVCASASVNPLGTVLLDYNDYSSFWVAETD